MTSEKIRHKFIEFFRKNGHHQVQSSSLWPQDDPSVLLTTAGMQQFKSYFMGVQDPVRDFGGTRLCSIQRCFRTSDIDEVGDATHATFFEMLGNFSFGDYFKEEAIDYAWKFLTKEMRVESDRLWVTYFKGEDELREDTEAVRLWQKYVDKNRIIGFGRSDNWWGPTGTTGPCGPCSELHYDFTGQPCDKGKACVPNCDCGRFMEIWNLVFTEFHMNEHKKVKPLPSKNIDTGMGLERLSLVVQKKKSVFDTDLFEPIIQAITADKSFGSVTAYEDTVRSRIIADHLKGTVHLLADGIQFSNKEQGYILRRIFRRALDQYLYPHMHIESVIKVIRDIYGTHNTHIATRHLAILEAIRSEMSSYAKILEMDVAEAVNKIQGKKLAENQNQSQPSGREITPDEAFILYTTYGLSPERLKREGFLFDYKKFQDLILKHQEQSRAGAEKKFGGHGLNSTELTDNEKTIMTKYHTATHLLQQALRVILGDTVHQEGSDITPERLRFDFAYPEKLTDEQKKKVENLVNEKIKEDLPVTSQTMSYDDALKSGALAFFKEKYPDMVTVYSVGDFSKELCGGPHVARTGGLGTFTIVSEKSSSAGIRRIKATLS